MGLSPRRESDAGLSEALYRPGAGVLAPAGSARDGSFLKMKSGVPQSQRASALAQMRGDAKGARAASQDGVFLTRARERERERPTDSVASRLERERATREALRKQSGHQQAHGRARRLEFEPALAEWRLECESPLAGCPASEPRAAARGKALGRRLGRDPRVLAPPGARDHPGRQAPRRHQKQTREESTRRPAPARLPVTRIYIFAARPRRDDRARLSVLKS